MPRRFPIAYKLALAITTLITISMASLGVVIVNKQMQLLRKQTDTFSRTIVKQMAESAKELMLANDRLGLKVLTSNLVSDESVLGTAIFSTDGKILAQSGVTPFNDATAAREQLTDILDLQPSQVLEWQWRESPATSPNVVSFVSPMRFQNMVVGYVLITSNRSFIDQSVRHSLSRITLATVFMILLAVLMSFLLAKRLSRPIHRLVEASRAIGKGDFDYRITERRTDEIGYLMAAFNSMAEGLLQKTKVESVFSRFVSTEVAKQILSDLSHVELGGKPAEGSVLFADIVEFTSMADRMSPRAIAELLNEYFSYICQASALCRGTIDKYIGDCVMIVFGVHQEDEDHCFQAIACAVLIQRIVTILNARRVLQGSFQVNFRMGLNTGEMIAGTMGSESRMQYTVVGDSVNLASRLCSLAGPGEIVISQEMYTHPTVQPRIVARKHQVAHVKGKRERVTTYLVQDVASPDRHIMDKHVEMILAEKVIA
ncbi:MAG: adenylate/guanylate cyclase domain-containing protein [Candidatus Methylomirabilales bacterium]